MPIALHWFLPTTGDSRSDLSHGDAVGARPGLDGEPGQRRADLAYLGQVARAAEQSGFEAALTPTSSWCPDPWIVTAALTQQTERLKFLVAFRPAFLSPRWPRRWPPRTSATSAAGCWSTSSPAATTSSSAAIGDFLPKAERYAQAGEFLGVLRGALAGGPIDFAGEHIRVEGAHVPEPPACPAALLRRLLRRRRWRSRRATWTCT